VNAKFPVLSIVSILIRILGWLGVVAGLYYLIYEGMIEPNLEGHKFGDGDILQIIQGFTSIIGGLVTVAIGEIIGVLFAIEKNTRKTSEK